MLFEYSLGWQYGFKKPSPYFFFIVLFLPRPIKVNAKKSEARVFKKYHFQYLFKGNQLLKNISEYISYREN